MSLSDEEVQRIMREACVPVVTRLSDTYAIVRAAYAAGVAAGARDMRERAALLRDRGDECAGHN